MTISRNQILISIASTIFAGFLTFTVHRIYIHQPEVFATKVEVKDLKGDICDRLNDLKQIITSTNQNVNWLIQQKIEENKKN